MDIAFQSARQLASLIRRKKIGCLELLDLYLARIERHNRRAQRHRRHSTSKRRASRREPPTALREGRGAARCTACR